MHDFVLMVTDFLRELSHTLPLTWFILIGSFIEEVVSPIPSALITTIVGSIAQAKEKGILFIIALSFVGSLGKTLASLLFYVAADKLEDVFIKKIGPVFGITHEDVESVGKRLTKDWRDDAVVFSLRAIPFAPTAVVSVVCGLIKMNLRSFLFMTFLGYAVRILFLLLIAYLGVDLLQSLNSPLLTSFSLIAGFVATVLVTSYLIKASRQQKQNDTRPDERKKAESTTIIKE